MASVYMVCQIVSADGPARFRAAKLATQSDARAALEVWLEDLQLSAPRLLFVVWLRDRRGFPHELNADNVPVSFALALARLEIVGAAIPRGDGLSVRWDCSAFAE